MIEPNQAAADLYALGINQCCEQGIPLSYLRVFFWPKHEANAFYFNGGEWSVPTKEELEHILFAKPPMGAHLQFGSMDEAKEYGQKTLLVSLEASQKKGEHVWIASAPPSLSVSREYASVSVGVVCRKCGHKTGISYSFKGKVPRYLMHHLTHYEIDPPKSTLEGVPKCKK